MSLEKYCQKCQHRQQRPCQWARTDSEQIAESGQCCLRRTVELTRAEHPTGLSAAADDAAGADAKAPTQFGPPNETKQLFHYLNCMMNALLLGWAISGTTCLIKCERESGTTMTSRVPQITGILESGVAEYFSSVQVSLAVDKGKPMTCRIRPDILQRMIIHLSEMAAHIRSQTLNEGQPYSVPAIIAIDANAHSSTDGTVIVSVKAGNKVTHHFALAPEIAVRLRSKLQESEEPARS
jgi:hypothetical protein